MDIEDYRAIIDGSVLGNKADSEEEGDSFSQNLVCGSSHRNITSD